MRQEIVCVGDKVLRWCLGYGLLAVIVYAVVHYFGRWSTKSATFNFEGPAHPSFIFLVAVTLLFSLGVFLGWVWHRSNELTKALLAMFAAFFAILLLPLILWYAFAWVAASVFITGSAPTIEWVVLPWCPISGACSYIEIRNLLVRPRPILVS